MVVIGNRGAFDTLGGVLWNELMRCAAEKYLDYKWTTAKVIYVAT